MTKKSPVICIDEKPYQLLDDRREPLPMKQGSHKRFDNEYERMGTCSIFVMVEPLTGWHHANGRERRTAIDFAYEIEWLLTSTESPYKNASKVRLIVDQLSTHNIASLYKAFAAPHARELAKRLEIHYTPKHGSWLNVAEIAISTLSKQCIDRRIPTLEKLNKEIAAWQANYNATCKHINWQFTTEDARVKLRKLYPLF